ncbi:hypothetical protein NKG05_21340 [Oerskovia sp. M15]
MPRVHARTRHPGRTEPSGDSRADDDARRRRHASTGRQPRYGQRAPQPPTGGAPTGEPGQYGQPAPNAWGSPVRAAGPVRPTRSTGSVRGAAVRTAPARRTPQPGYGPPAFAGMPYVPPASKPGIIPLRPLSLGEIFDGAFGAIRSNPKVMLGMSATVIAVATIVGMALGALVSGIFAPQIAQLESELGSDAAGITEIFPSSARRS